LIWRLPPSPPVSPILVDPTQGESLCAIARIPQFR
jgi:hypothetical protein